IGLYSMYASMKPGVTIYAFEPSAFNFALLVEHVALNKKDNQVNPLCVALSNQTGVFPLHLANLSVGRAGNALHEAKNQDGTFQAIFKQSVPGMRGDDAVKLLGIPAPTHIKLDVDGIEGPILAGMPNVLTSVRQVLVEVEGENAIHFDARIAAPLTTAGLREDASFRDKGNPRNRLFIR
ncbi:MAG TPA: FkbM family methyltransferase, partial [Alphaproteobacteria bacterium]